MILLWKIFKSLALKPLGKAIDDRITRKFDKILSEPYVKKEPNKFFKWWKRNEDAIEKWGRRVYFGFLGLVCSIVIVGSLIKLFEKNGLYVGFTIIFAIIGICTTVIFILWGVISFFDTDIWKGIKGMSYSIKNKVCPIIKWD